MSGTVKRETRNGGVVTLFDVESGSGGLRAVRSDRRTAIDGTALRRGRRAIGTLEAGTLRLGGAEYVIRVVAHPGINPERRASVEVVRDGRLIARGDAMALCDGSDGCSERAAIESDIEDRVALYLSLDAR